MSTEVVPYKDLESMAQQVVRSRLFPGLQTPEQVMALFLVAQAEGLHPMTATMRYNIIQNRPAMKAEAMLASFMERGGTVDWAEYTNEAVTGIFTSPGCPKGVTVRWTIEDAVRAGITGNPTWKKYPKQMLKARVASDGVRMTDPAVNQGRYTPEEVQDFDTPKVKPADYEVVGAEAGQSGQTQETPAPPAIPSATGLSTEEHLAESKRRRDAAVRKFVTGAQAPPDDDAPIQEKLEKVRKQANKAAGRPKNVPDFCESCNAAVMRYEASDGSGFYWECVTRNRDRNVMKEQDVAEEDMRKFLHGHFFSWAGTKK